ncbi:DUF5017 domain-containing protein [Chitinophagaceae bacterium LB-8]|uniref:DUF5017 domain-containing protein n=1 Tax=Paraflavisolibacter caeni TaxID=2982496 RepID=A0A9X3B7I1_9BACT|nr:DUF5017 domain-containing protein [Paraflavisolibacter caeni]MCU7549245.1 DUF5017 domain-containing protein [Paraflavisolibacter caeni]
MFSYKNIFLIMLSGVLIASCDKKDVDLAAINTFNVKADSTKSAEPSNDTAYYTLGSKTTFNFTGNPVGVTFYSGEVGHRYIYRNRTSAAGISQLNFTNALNTGTQANSLQVMLSFDFKGVVVGDTAATLANISAANWNDVTPANMATNATAVTNTVDLSSYAKSGKRAFIAFKYTAAAGSVQNKWTITNLSITNSLPDNTTYTLANLNAPTTSFSNYGVLAFSPGWIAYPVANTYNWAVTAGTSLVITGAATAAAATSNAEAWAIMGGIDLTKVTPDVGVPVKDITVTTSPYKYTYPAIGKYEAVFAATNLTVYTTDTVVRKLPVVIQ